MGKFVHIAALALNALVIFVVFVFLLVEARGYEYLIFSAFMVPPIMSIIALLQIPGAEERKLSKEVRLARLKKELEEFRN